ncbi:MAG: hypothetical protein [Bacteriophage sp.]|jgi:hypothetical protein|nr:MAG: hypothetical protein [Bacteriophage sp.]UVY28721.1 MAG: hypothetical protein [Bacteriophage sp.]UVY42772.1 MAG: hypothetical protein [Bacteriophage sp.]UVY56588.1 MAG: hypothetical protein [Bacteriophage sp.]UVY65828.1 MAG: hypothetical protein [Bacteriophage sp.]
MKKLLDKVLNIRGIMAFILTVTFAVLAILRIVTPSEFMTIFTAVIVYFFVDTKNNGKGSKKNE